MRQDTGAADLPLEDTVLGPPPLRWQSPLLLDSLRIGRFFSVLNKNRNPQRAEEEQSHFP